MDGPRERRTLVLLHAAGHGPQLWQPQMDALGQEFDLLVPDLGDTRPNRRFRIDRAADAVADLIATRPNGGSAAVCGLSLGAFVALEVAARHPERVDALVLSGGQIRPRRVLLAANYTLLNLLPGRVVVPDGGSRRALLASYRSLFAWDARALPARVRAPTLVLVGGRDRANAAAARDLAAAIPGAELRTVPGAGHLWNGTHPDEFNRLLREFLARAPASHRPPP